MQNIEISRIFSNIGDFLQIRGEASFKIRSYQKAARILADLTVDVRELIESGKFQNIPGIGKTIEEKTKEILDTGTCEAYQKLKTEMGLESLELLDVQGVGGKTANRLYYDHNIKSVKQLEQAVQDGSLQSVKGFGKKTLQTIADSLQFINTNRGIRLSSIADTFAQNLSSILNQCETVVRFDLTGEVRRCEEVCRSIGIVVQCRHNVETTENDILEKFLENKQKLALKLVERDERITVPIILKRFRRIHFHIDNDFPVVLYLCDVSEYDSILFLTTASEEHLSALPKDANINIDLHSENTAYWMHTKDDSETRIYEKLGMCYVPPELRQFSDAVSLALENRLPSLIELTDIRGDLHTHTEWSDGRNTMDQMVETANAQGLEYLGITDHSASSTVANGLDQKRLLAQIQHVHQLNERIEGITLLAGSEVDIRPNGSLDYPDDVLAQLDIVIASIHSQFTQSEAAMTERMIAAIENPYVKIIGHPTGRLLGSRPMYPIDVDAVIRAAAENDTVLEINASPSRLDLGPEYVRKAKEAGVLMSINTDAHSKSQFEFRRFGVNVARRSGLTKDDVINTYSLEKLHEKHIIKP